jgi:hypothetical protein
MSFDMFIVRPKDSCGCCFSTGFEIQSTNGPDPTKAYKKDIALSCIMEVCG